MKETRQIMGMPVSIICSDESVGHEAMETIFTFFEKVDTTYSPYIATSDVVKINRGELQPAAYSDELRAVLAIAKTTKQQTHGYFDVWHAGIFDPSGIVKGWAIQEAARLLTRYTKDFFIEAGGDIQVSGNNPHYAPWKVGVRNPFNRTENIAVVQLRNEAIATSGTAIRGQHIYNPTSNEALSGDIVSISVISTRIVDADCFATAAFAMEAKGIDFIESLDGYEGYMVSKDKLVTMTSGWKEYER